MRSLSPLVAAVVCVLGLPATASNDALSRQTNSPLAHPTTAPSLTVDKVMTDNELFENVPFDTNEQNRCSPPEPNISWRGVQVRAPNTPAATAEACAGACDAFDRILALAFGADSMP